MSYEPCQRVPLDWRAECIFAATEIYEKEGDRIRICLSGGVDSEVTAESFRLARIPFTAAILRFNSDANFHDIAWAISYCQKHNIKYELYNLDIPSYLESSEFREIANRTGCLAPGIVYQMKLAQLLAEKNYFPVIGAGDCFLKKIEDRWYLSHSELYLSLFRYQLAFNVRGVFRFFQYTPEIVLSFLLAPKVSALINNQFGNLTNNDLIKVQIINDYFSVPARKKYTGVEKLRQKQQKISQDLYQLNPTSYSYFHMGYYQALESLRKK